MKNPSLEAAPIVRLWKLIDELSKPNTGPRGRVQSIQLRSEILRAADRCTFDELFGRAYRLDDPILQPLVLNSAGVQRLLLHHVLTLGMQHNVTLAPQDTAIINSLTRSFTALTGTFYRCLPISSAHRAFRRSK
jgi:hypothetical protein